MGQAGAWCEATEICFRYDDPGHALTGVRLQQGVLPRGTDTRFRYAADAGVW